VAVTAPARTGLAMLPTPLVEAGRLADGLGITGPLLVKRDDLTGFAVAGNKARQLESLLAEAIAQDADVLVTGGTVGSNFVPAAVAAAAYSGLRCVVVLAGDPVERTSHPNLAAAMAWGAELRWTGSLDRTAVDAMLPEVAAELTRDGARPYVAPRGGASATGALGYRWAVDEVVAQLAGRTPTVVVAVGAGGTLAGLVAGVVAHGRPFRVVGASVSRAVEDVAPRVLELAQQVARRGGDEPAQAQDITLVDARGPGHGIASPAGDAAAEVGLRCAGLVLDPVYTAKALAVLPAIVPDGPALFWHTGGLLDAVAGLLERT
jgi:D-cysteine desulfhydrase